MDAVQKMQDERGWYVAVVKQTGTRTIASHPSGWKKTEPVYEIVAASSNRYPTSEAAHPEFMAIMLGGPVPGASGAA